MAIYKYVSAASGLAYLSSWHLKYSRAREFNDPFDVNPSLNAADASRLFGRFVDVSNTPGLVAAEIRRSERALKFAETVRQTVFDVYGILCFTRTRNHLLMWAHYADDHKGMLLGFDEGHACFCREHEGNAVGKLRAVVYRDHRPALDRITSEVVLRAYFTKSLEWAYEQEERLLWPATKADRTAGNNLLYGVPPDALCELVLGCRATLDTARTVQAVLTKDAPHVNAQQAVPRASDFGLDYVTYRGPSLELADALHKNV